jgi:RNA polymerase sigma-54 factor
MQQGMRQVLTPRMIQSMEILQMPLQALEERIEQELASNPTLELSRSDAEDAGLEKIENAGAEREERSESERSLVIDDNNADAKDFARLDRLGDYLENEEFYTNSSQGSRTYRDNGEPDKKMEALANTAARGETLTDYLRHQWTFVECPPAVRQAGNILLNHIDADGYLRTEFQVIQHDSREPVSMEDLNAALALIQKLEPAGVGARTLKESLLLQLDAVEDDPDLAADHHLELERALVRDHLRDLEMNRFPQIARKLGKQISEIQAAAHGLSRLSPRPGLLIGDGGAPGITPDAIVWLNEDTGKYEVKMTRDRTPHLHLSNLYRKMIKDRQVDKTTREFLANHLRNARWLIESIEQRGGTLLRVVRAVVDAQREFLEKGPEHLKPLPMILLADQLGIHVATVSRAVSEKWIQTPRGVFPLRRFFSGGTTSSSGEDMSWDAVKEKLRMIVDQEDKKNPLNDDEIVDKLKEQGIVLARRTVAKYRKILNIAPARQRRAF